MNESSCKRGSQAGSRALFRRAEDVIPGGMHLSGRALLGVEKGPAYFDKAKGCRIWDVDGKEYIDYLMAYGAVLVGYAVKEVDEAAHQQAARGNLVSLNHPIHVDFIERLIDGFASADMGVFCKTGSEATTAALRIARHFTGRRGVARCGYHGWHDWCLAGDASVPEIGDQVVEYDARRPESLRALLERHPGRIAAVICAPEMVWPLDRAIFEELIAITHQHDALFVFDEIKTGFRAPRGSVQDFLGLIPDLTTVSKALGNGWPVAAVVGRRAVMESARELHLSATYHGETASMAASLETMSLLTRWSVAKHVAEMGERLIDGLNDSAARHHLPAVAYGEPFPSMPFLRFTGDDDTTKAVRATFFEQAIARGLLLHPRHLWFISHGHQADDIAHSIAVADEAMAATRERHRGVL